MPPVPAQLRPAAPRRKKRASGETPRPLASMPAKRSIRRGYETGAVHENRNRRRRNIRPVHRLGAVEARPPGHAVRTGAGAQSDGRVGRSSQDHPPGLRRGGRATARRFPRPTRHGTNCGPTSAGAISIRAASWPSAARRATRRRITWTDCARAAGPARCSIPARAAERWPFLDPDTIRFAFSSPEGGALHCRRIAFDMAGWLQAQGVMLRQNMKVSHVDPARATVTTEERKDDRRRLCRRHRRRMGDEAVSRSRRGT